MVQSTTEFPRHWQLYLIMLPALLCFFVFKYGSMAGAIIAFKDFNVVGGRTKIYRDPAS